MSRTGELTVGFLTRTPRRFQPYRGPMFDRLEIAIVPPGPRYVAHLRLLVSGEDIVTGTVGEGGRGPYAEHALAAEHAHCLAATGERRRLELGAPECTGGCRGYLSADVQRFGPVVRWSDWQVPAEGTRRPDAHCEAGDHDAELDRAAAAWRRTRM